MNELYSKILWQGRHFSIQIFPSWDLYNTFNYFPIIKPSLMFSGHCPKEKVYITYKPSHKTSYEIQTTDSERHGIFSTKDSVGSGWKQKKRNKSKQTKDLLPKAHTCYAPLLLSKFDLSVRLSNMLLAMWSQDTDPAWHLCDAPIQHWLHLELLNPFQCFADCEQQSRPWPITT